MKVFAGAGIIGKYDVSDGPGRIQVKCGVREGNCRPVVRSARIPEGARVGNRDFYVVNLLIVASTLSLIDCIKWIAAGGVCCSEA